VPISAEGGETRAERGRKEKGNENENEGKNILCTETII
jgi:hypothetical protein